MGWQECPTLSRVRHRCPAQRESLLHASRGTSRAQAEAPQSASQAPLWADLTTQTGRSIGMDEKGMVVGVFKDRNAAERAYQTAKERGYGDEEVHVMMSDDTRKRHFKD